MFKFFNRENQVKPEKPRRTTPNTHTTTSNTRLIIEVKGERTTERRPNTRSYRYYMFSSDDDETDNQQPEEWTKRSLDRHEIPSNLPYFSPSSATRFQTLVTTSLRDILVQEIAILIAEYCIEPNNFVALSATRHLLDDERLSEMCGFFQTFGKQFGRYRSCPGTRYDGYRSGDNSEDEESEAKVLDILDPNMCVASIPRPDGKTWFQYVPSVVHFDADGKSRILTNVNWFSNPVNGDQSPVDCGDWGEKLFEYLECVTDAMFPHFEDVLQMDAHATRDVDLQIIYKVIQYEVPAEASYATRWHVDGMPYEHIKALGIVYTCNSDPNLSGNLQFSPDISSFPDSSPHGSGLRHQGDMFALQSATGTCVVWNNEKLVHRLDHIEIGVRQAVLLMLVDPSSQLLTFGDANLDVGADVYGCGFANAAERVGDVRGARRIDLKSTEFDHVDRIGKMVNMYATRMMYYCVDCGVVGHIGSMCIQPTNPFVIMFEESGEADGEPELSVD